MNNLPIKVAFLFFVFLFFLPNSQAQTLEIHQMSVGQGDAALIVVRDTQALANAIRARGDTIPAERYKMLKQALDSNIVLTGSVLKATLIDAGKGGTQADHIWTYMQKIGVGKKDISHFLISHFHDDHYGGMKKLMKTYGVYPDTMYVRGWNPPYTYNNQKAEAVMDLITANNDSLLVVGFTTTDLFLGKQKHQAIQLTCIGSETLILGDDADRPTANNNNENNFSTQWLLQYGGFRYYTAGDLNGENGGNKIPLEHEIADSIKSFDNATFQTFANAPMDKGHVCSMKINHHGSEESSNPYLFTIFKPSTAMISCGWDKGYVHPRPSVIEVLDSMIERQWNTAGWPHSAPNTVMNNTIAHYYLTTLMDMKPYWTNQTMNDVYNKIGTNNSTGIIGGDIVLVVNDKNIDKESSYYVFWNGKKATSVVGNKKVNTPNTSGGHYIQCHQVSVLNYITNH